MKKTLNILFAVVCAIAMAAGVQARDQDPVGLTPTTEDAQGIAKKPSYSPYAERGFPTQVFWGDTHVHTDNSLDARGFGVTLGPEEAFRFARGEEVTTSNGLPFKLSRPLDWLVVADHSDGMGAMKEIIAGNPNLLKDPEVKKWHTAMRTGGEAAFEATMNVINAFSQGKVPKVVLDRTFQQTVWDD
ncbi:MAG: DUF3604 domain-containing protein, partial [Desulfobacterales bacterium]